MVLLRTGGWPRRAATLAGLALATSSCAKQASDPAPAPSSVSASASESPPSRPPAPLPLREGVYVVAGSGCEQPANAAIRVYDGAGISGSATHDCRARVMDEQGERF